ncbi:MAG: hypothetical protein WB992_22970 [Bryobacteraceae bacterium]
MTIDERLDRLTERHEALAQSLEIIAGMLAGMQKENEKAIAELTGKLSELTGNMTELTGLVKTIGMAVLNHERRLDNLEKPGNLPPSQN